MRQCPHRRFGIWSNPCRIRRQSHKALFSDSLVDVWRSYDSFGCAELATSSCRGLLMIGLCMERRWPAAVGGREHYRFKGNDAVLLL